MLAISVLDIPRNLLMRKLTLFAHTSLDGVISPGAPDDDSDYANGEWTAPYRGAAGATAVAEAQGARFDLLLGRRTSPIHRAENSFRFSSLLGLRIPRNGHWRR